jgi:type I restriction enzyme S subunit
MRQDVKERVEMINRGEVPEGYKKNINGDIIPKTWYEKKIGAIAEVSTGGTPERCNADYWRGDIPWVTTSLIDFKTIFNVEEFISKEGLNNSAAKIMPPNTIIMAMYGQGVTRGKVAILGISATTNQACCGISVHEDYSYKFIFYNLTNKYSSIRKLSNDGKKI